MVSWDSPAALPAESWMLPPLSLRLLGKMPMPSVSPSRTSCQNTGVSAKSRFDGDSVWAVPW